MGDIEGDGYLEPPFNKNLNVRMQIIQSYG